MRSSKTDQEAKGTVKALPHGRDPVTCPPCAYVRWREVLHAVDSAPDGGTRRAVMRVLHRQAGNETVCGAREVQSDSEHSVQHVCHTAGVAEPTDPHRVLFPSVHATGAIRDRAMTGHAVNEMMKRRAAAAGFTPAQTALLGAHSLRAGFVTEAFRQGRRRPRDHAADRAPLPGDARGLRPGMRPAGRQRCHPPGALRILMTDDAAARTSPTPSGYAAIWALFTDWCEVIGAVVLPAEPTTVLAFLAGCPVAPETRRRRVAAIDHRHAAAGLSPPGRSVAVLAALGRPTAGAPQVPVETAAAVEAALRALPSHHWTQGMFGRRDRCLLALSQFAGVPYKHLAGMTAGDVTVVEGMAVVTGSAGEWTLAPDDDPVVCGCCAVIRWLRVVDLAVRKINTGVVAAAVGKAEAVTGQSPHICRSNRELNDATRAVPLFPPITCGALCLSRRNRSPRTRSRAGSATSSPGTWGHTGTFPSTRTTRPRQRTRRSHRWRNEPDTAGGTRKGRGIEAGPTLLSWATSRQNSRTLVGVPMKSICERPHCSPNTWVAFLDEAHPVSISTQNVLDSHWVWPAAARPGPLDRRRPGLVSGVATTVTR